MMFHDQTTCMLWISIYGYPYMDIHIWISIYGYPYGYPYGYQQAFVSDLARFQKML